MNLFVIIGIIIGYSIDRLGGAILGGLIGYGISRLFGRRLIQGAVGSFQGRFVDSTFSVMGAACKADGQVSEDEIRAAERLFDQLRLTPKARAKARAAFNRGKTPGFDLDAAVREFAQSVRGNPVMLQIFLQVQLSAIAADGTLHPAEREILIRIANGLGLSAADVERLEAMLSGDFFDPGSWGAGPQNARPSGQSLNRAYQVIGVPPTASDAELKRAYRKLMSEHHPDKLAGRGLPESMREMAERKTREITAAYQLIERARQVNPA